MSNKYEELILPYLEDKYEIVGSDVLTECPWCSFFEQGKYTLKMSLESGLYSCNNDCGRSGNLVQFIADKEGISTKEASAIINNFYTVAEYSREKKIGLPFLKDLGLKTGANNSIEIPFYNEDGQEIAVKRLYKNSKYIWNKDSKVDFYGLWKLKEFTDKSYIFLTRREDIAQVLWLKKIQALALPVGKKFQKEFSILFEEFDEVYVIVDGSLQATAFVREVCKSLPFEKLYKLSTKKIDENCPDPLTLYWESKLNLESLIGAVEKISQDFYDKQNQKPSVESEEEAEEEEPPEEHVIIANKVMEQLEIRYYRSNFYVYDNGVYRRKLPLIEKTILSIKNNAKKNLRNEVLEFIRINNNIDEMDMNEQYVNFQNGILDFTSLKLLEHTPKIFTTVQIHANYIDEEELIPNKYMQNFIKDIMCNNPERELALFQITGYCMTCRTDLQLAFFFYRTFG